MRYQIILNVVLSAACFSWGKVSIGESYQKVSCQTPAKQISDCICKSFQYLKAKRCIEHNIKERCQRDISDITCKGVISNCAILCTCATSFVSNIGYKISESKKLHQNKQKTLQQKEDYEDNICLGYWSQLYLISIYLRKFIPK